MATTSPNPGTRTEPTISYHFVAALCDAIDDNPDAIRHGLLRFELNDLDSNITRVPLRRYTDLLEWLAVELRQPYLGLELSQQAGPETLGAISYMFLGSKNLEQALRNFSHYLRTVQDSSQLYLEVDGEYAFVHYGILDQRITNRRQDSEYSIGYVWRLMQIFSANGCRLTTRSTRWWRRPLPANLRRPGTVPTPGKSAAFSYRRTWHTIQIGGPAPVPDTRSAHAGVSCPRGTDRLICRPGPSTANTGRDRTGLARESDCRPARYFRGDVAPAPGNGGHKFQTFV